ncbi:MAG: DNA cytosine methyltransferase [Bacillota bacterium]
MRVADFFCGAGGFSEGFRQAGFDIVFAIDKWLPAYNTYKANKPATNVVLDDVIRVSNLPDEEFDKLVPDTEVIIGSPPCVAFSSSNKSGNGDKTLGIKLFEAYLRIVARKKYKEGSILKYWVLENVPNIRNYIKSEYTADDLGLKGDFILKVINGSSEVYNAKYFGVPSKRQRFLCGEFPTPQPTNGDAGAIPLRTVLEALGEPCANDRNVIVDCNYPDLKMNVHDVSDHQYEFIVPEFEWKKAKRLKQDKGYMGKMSFPEDINKPSRTVMATMSACSRESMILGRRDGTYRLPTVREIASMMSFPIDYKFYGVSKGVKYTLVGNAVPPKLSYAVAVAIRRSEGLAIPKGYTPIQHNDAIDFYNLNFVQIPEKEEKQKRIDAKFKYHIPYLILDAYRVELTNYHSKFKDNNIIWSIEIHHSQGKEKARVFTPNIVINDIEESFRFRIAEYINNTRARLCSEAEFQMRHRMTDAQRKGLVGPMELLEGVRALIDEIMSPEQQSKICSLNEEPYKIPSAIQVGYFLLTECLTIIRGYN